MSKIMVIGDVHGDWSRLNELLNRRKPELVLQVGDFGYFPRIIVQPQPAEHGEIRHGSKPKSNHPFDPVGQFQPHRATINWIDGNHEDHATLGQLAEGKLDPVEIAPNVYYQPRGSTLTLPDGRVILFLGGARSVDQWQRKEGVDWFPQEQLGPEVLAILPPAADIVISHTAPTSFDLSAIAATPEEIAQCGWDIVHDPSRDVLQEVLERLKPSRWFFGHYHRHYESRTGTCRWTALADIRSFEQHWAWLEDDD